MKHDRKREQTKAKERVAEKICTLPSKVDTMSDISTAKLRLVKLSFSMMSWKMVLVGATGKIGGVRTSSTSRMMPLFVTTSDVTVASPLTVTWIWKIAG